MCLCLGTAHIALLVISMLLSWAGACYFPIELQGEYVVQVTTSTPGNLVQYSQVNITAEAIPIWGHCHRRLGNRFILTDSFGGPNCSRCFHIILRSRNILQVRTEGLEKCYTNEDAAEATCPDEKAFKQGDISKAIIFYKTKDLGGEDIKQVYCPINGRFNFVYSITDGSIDSMKCRDPVSEMDNCPSGSELNLHYRSCEFPNKDVTFQCLGHWAGPGDQHYLALRDTSSVSQHQLPPYRCALYKEEAGTGNIFMALSSDSTCNSNLRSATSGFEVFSLSVVPSIGWPSQVDNSNCRFPPWSYGYWQHIYIEVSTLTYKDHSTFKTYTIRCLGPEAATSERFAVFARTQCGEEMYNCIWLKRRGVNVLEFQLGLQSSTYYNSTLCSDSNFESKVWVTQGRLERLQESPCPVAGEYEGIIPDATNLCAKLSSDCRSPEIMYYMVSDCSHSEIYEGTRRRGRKRRQTGTKIYRISNPRSSTTPTPASLPIPDGGISHNGSYGGDNQVSETKYLRTNFSHQASVGPRYPTAYHIDTNPMTTYSSTEPQDTFSEEVYDPWTYSKTPSQHEHNQTGSNSYYENHRPPSWTTQSYSGWSGTKVNRNWSSPQPNQWSTSSYPVSNSDWQGGSYPGQNRNQYGTDYYPDGKRNQGFPHNEGNYRIPDNYPGGNRKQDFPESQYPQRTQREGIGDPYRNEGFPQSTQRTLENYPVTSRNEGFPQRDYSHSSHDIFENNSAVNRNQGFLQNKYPQSTSQRTYENYPGNQRYHQNEYTQRTIENHPGTSRNQNYPQNENMQPNQRTFENYPSSNRNEGIAQNKNPQSTQRTHGNYPIENENSGFPQNEYPQSTQRTHGSYPIENENSGFPQNEYPHPAGRTYENYPGSNRNNGFPPNDFQQSQSPHRIIENHPQVNRNQAPYPPQSPQRTFENYPRESRNQDEHSHSTDRVFEANRNSYTQNVYHQPQGRFDGPQGGTRNQGPQNTYHIQRDDVTRDEFRKQNEYSDSQGYPGRHNTARPHSGPTISTPAIGIIDRSHPTGLPNAPERRYNWENPNSRPVPFLPMPVERSRYGDRPIAVPRTAAPMKREEREYRCLGQWKEDGLMYTYTQRRDVGTYECFVGSIISDNEIYIKEAGDHCQRNIDPMHYGMKLSRKGPCLGNSPVVNPGGGELPQSRPTTSWMSSRRPPEPTKPWKPITAPPKDASGADTYRRLFLVQFLLAFIVIYFVYQQ